MTPTREQVIQWALEAGFKVFGDKIVAADHGSSGLASECCEKLVSIVFAAGKQSEREKFDEAGYSNYLGDPVLYMDVPGGTKLYRILEEQ